jgi:hypothetical protein
MLREAEQSSFGGMEVADVKRLKQLEQENARIERFLAERDLEVEVMKERDAKNERLAANAVCYLSADPRAQCHHTICSFRWTDSTRRRS